MKWQCILISFNVDILVKSVVAESLMFVVFAVLQVLDKILPFIIHFHLRSCICLMVCSGFIQVLIYTYFISSLCCVEHCYSKICHKFIKQPICRFVMCHLDTGFSWFPCVYKRMLRWFPSFQVTTTCFSCSPPDLNFLVTFFSPFIFVYM